MTIRCTVCGDDFKAWSDREEVCPVCKALIAGERRQAEEPAVQERKPKKRPVQRRKKTNAGNDGFAAYEAAAREAKKAGKWPVIRRVCRTQIRGTEKNRDRR